MKSDPFYKETDSRVYSRLVFATTSVTVTHDTRHVPLLGVQWVLAQKWAPAVALRVIIKIMNTSMLYRCHKDVVKFNFIYVDIRLYYIYTI